MKKVNPATAKESLGTRLAEKTRAVANTLTDEEREQLLHRGMQMIYGTHREKPRTARR